MSLLHSMYVVHMPKNGDIIEHLDCVMVPGEGTLAVPFFDRLCDLPLQLQALCQNNRSTNHNQIMLQTRETYLQRRRLARKPPLLHWNRKLPVIMDLAPDTTSKD